MDQQILDTLNAINEHSDNVEKIALVFFLLVMFALGFHKGGQR